MAGQTIARSDNTFSLRPNYLGGCYINSPEDLAKQMARLTKSIRLATEEALTAETQDGELHQLRLI